jgi:malic enzyme
LQRWHTRFGLGDIGPKAGLPVMEGKAYFTSTWVDGAPSCRYQIQMQIINTIDVQLDLVG